jgi:hypothetical protein
VTRDASSIDLETISNERVILSGVKDLDRAVRHPVPAIASQIAAFRCHATGVDPHRHRILFCLLSFVRVWL